MHDSWKKVLKSQLEAPYFQDLVEFVQSEREQYEIYPKRGDVFRAFDVPYEEVRVVILGQDPYHGPGQAHGLSFSVPKGITIPPSLVNIYKELYDDLGCKPPNHGCLLDWTKQGVLLLNSVLTVRAGSAGSHRGQGWERFTDAVVESLNRRGTPMVFLLWGRQAQQKAMFIDDLKNEVLISTHPSPFSAFKGFIGSRPFSKANRA